MQATFLADPLYLTNGPDARRYGLHILKYTFPVACEYKIILCQGPNQLVAGIIMEDQVQRLVEKVWGT